MTWREEIEARAREDAESYGRRKIMAPEEHALLRVAREQLRMALVIRDAEQSLEKIQRKARDGFIAEPGDDATDLFEYIDDVATSTLGFIARGGDEQSPTAERQKPA